MRSGRAVLVLCALAIAARLLPAADADGGSRPEDEDAATADDYSERAVGRFSERAQKRACIRRGGTCDHRSNDCCYNSSCRCNLWGSNCRCQRMGLFQKWG